MVAWVVGHQVFDILALLLQPALFFAWLYVLTLPPIGAVTYYSVLVLVGWYTSGLGYLVSIVLSFQVISSARHFLFLPCIAVVAVQRLFRNQYH